MNTEYPTWDWKHQFKYLRKRIGGKYVSHILSDAYGPTIWFKVDDFEEHEKRRSVYLKGRGQREVWK